MYMGSVYVCIGSVYVCIGRVYVYRHVIYVCMYNISRVTLGMVRVVGDGYGRWGRAVIPPPHPGSNSLRTSVVALVGGSEHLWSPDSIQCRSSYNGHSHSLFSDKVPSVYECVGVSDECM